MANQQTADGFKLNYRRFHPQSTVWVQNPFDHDVIFQVADEHNNPYQYKLPAHKVSELPGGSVATLGVKSIVDELIQNSKDVLRIWDEEVRSKHEEAVILRIKEVQLRAPSNGPIGEIDLSVNGDKSPELELPPEEPTEEEFPDLNKKSSKNKEIAAEVSNIAQSALSGKKDAIIESD